MGENDLSDAFSGLQASQLLEDSVCKDLTTHLHVFFKDSESQLNKMRQSISLIKYPQQQNAKGETVGFVQSILTHKINQVEAEVPCSFLNIPCKVKAQVDNV